MFVHFIFSLFLGSCLRLAFAQEPTIPLISLHNSFFIDTTHTLAPRFIEELDELAVSFEKKGFQIAGFFAKTTSKMPVELATEFGNANRIGFKDNGIAIAVLLEKANAKGQKPTIGVAVGKKLEGFLTDAKIGRLLDNTYVKQRALGNWQKGLKEFIQTTAHYLDNPNAKEFADVHAQKQLPQNVKFLFLILLIIILILWLTKPKGPLKNGPHKRFYMNTLYGPRSSGFGGTGRGGGGGGFGGGGASR